MATLDRHNPQELSRYVVDWSAMSQTTQAGGPLKQKPSLLSHLSVLGRHWWKIGLFVTLVVATTAAISRRIQPMYESTALIDADRQASSGVIGEDAARSYSESDTDEFLGTQVKLIQSDAVLRPVADKYKLLLVEHQRANRSGLAEAPIELKHLKVVRSPRTHLLYITYRSEDRQLAADVANGIATSYIMHSYQTRVRASADLSRFMEAQLGELKEKMERSKQRLAQFARELDVVDPEQKSSVLSARLMELNTEYTKAQADRVAKEASYESMKKGTLAAVQVSSQAASLNALSERVNALRSIFVSVKSTYAANHPLYKKAAADLDEGIRQYDEATKQISQRIDVDYQQAAERERKIRESVVVTKADLDKLTSHALDYQQLKHEAEADTKLYEELVRRIREAGLNSGFQGNAIRMADVARPALEPVTPRPLLNIAVSFLCSLILAVGAVFMSEILNARVHGPDQVEQDLNARLVATLPNVRRLPATHNLEVEGSGQPLVRYVKGLPMAKDVASYEESIRQLRNSILLAERDGPVQSLLVTSGLPEEGKSTTALHLAISRANQRKRTLLIDADLRRPTLHTRLAIPDGPGLADVLTGDQALRDVVVELTEIPDLHVLRAGQAQGRASDLVGPSILPILREAKHEYDLIVVDAPPLLAFAETLQLAISVDGVVVITRAGSTSTQAVSTVLSTLASVQARVIGVVLNRFRANRRPQYYTDRQYGVPGAVSSGFARRV